MSGNTEGVQLRINMSSFCGMRL